MIEKIWQFRVSRENYLAVLGPLPDWLIYSVENLPGDFFRVRVYRTVEVAI